jgi:N-acetylmuramic acid 6-phosphate etherase
MLAMTAHLRSSETKFLGIEGGGTRTVALLVNSRGQVLRRLESGPANLQLLTDAELKELFRSIARALPRPDALGIGLAGGWTDADWQRIHTAAAEVWPQVPRRVSNDLETAMLAAAPESGARPSPGAAGYDRKRSARAGTCFARERACSDCEPSPQVLVVSGTGSGVYGSHPDGRRAKVGGWGHLLGDRGSGYDIAVAALRVLVEEQDRSGSCPALGSRILRALQLNEPNELIPWAQAATKAEIAGLAPEVFAAAYYGERLARTVLDHAAAHLAQAAAVCARKLAKPEARVRFVLAGGILLGQPRFAAQVAREIRKLWPGASVSPLRRESAWGAVELAKQAFEKSKSESHLQNPSRLAGASPSPRPSPKERGRSEASYPEHPAPPKSSAHGFRLSLSPEERVGVRGTSPTEARNPRSTKLDTLPVASAIRLMLSEEARVPEKLLAERRHIERVIRVVARAFRNGGRLFYVGAGTSGRLGVLDASECPPTFRASPEQVQGIIAGGREALWKSVEGAEDDSEAGGRAIVFRRITRQDVVVGIAASGTTPFVWGALQEARLRRATTVLVCFNPFAKSAAPFRPNIVIAPDLGPEILTGSTRLKAGTATKLLLNLFTTLAMVRLGKVRSNLMIDLHPANVKLRGRAVRIVQDLTRVDQATARGALERSGWVIQRALAWLGRRT